MGFKIHVERNSRGHVTAIDWRLDLPQCLTFLAVLDKQHIATLLFVAAAMAS